MCYPVRSHFIVQTSTLYKLHQSVHFECGGCMSLLHGTAHNNNISMRNTVARLLCPPLPHKRPTARPQIVWLWWKVIWCNTHKQKNHTRVLYVTYMRMNRFCPISMRKDVDRNIGNTHTQKILWLLQWAADSYLISFFFFYVLPKETSRNQITTTCHVGDWTILDVIFHT